MEKNIFKLIINTDNGMTEFHQSINSSENVIVQKIRNNQVVHELCYTKNEWDLILNKIFPIFKYNFELNFNYNNYYKELTRYRETLSAEFNNSIKNHFIKLLENY